VHKTEKRENQMKLFCFKFKSIKKSRPIIHSVALLDKRNHIVELLTCAETPNCCCVILWVYLDLLHI